MLMKQLGKNLLKTQTPTKLSLVLEWEKVKRIKETEKSRGMKVKVKEIHHSLQKQTQGSAQ